MEILVKSAKVEFKAQQLPSKSFFQHHHSISKLEASANNGSDFCQLLLEGLAQEFAWEWDQESFAWKVSESMTVLGHAQARVDAPGLNITINTDHVALSSPFSDVKLLDILCVLIGDSQT